jgi:hypothetical protein
MGNRLIYVIALLGLLALAMGCAQQAGNGNAQNASPAVNATAPGTGLTSADLPALENVSSDSADPGIPLEDI